MLLGDARTGKLADNIAGFGRALRRAGLRVDSSRIALAQEAAQLVGVHDKADLGAAMEAVLVSREPERPVFRELFDASMTASDLQRLKHADFNAMSASEFRLVERLAREVALPVPRIPVRRTR